MLLPKKIPKSTLIWVAILSIVLQGQASYLSTGLEDMECHQIKDENILDRFEAKQVDVSAVNLKSIIFKSKVYQIGPVILTQDEFRASAAPDSVSEVVVKLADKRAFGVLNGKTVGVVVVITTLGGTGTFYELALLIEDVENIQGWTNTDTVFLGDRVKVHSLAIERDHITVVMTMHRSQDAMCCPTLTVIKHFVVRDDRLVMVSEGTY
ncbi:hypothetical protein [Nitrosomonas sp. Nm34]|uniref:hypothetical protein n=1 Tax=Nitrosomonas sp. Nm34 TaxID=1881055 RepID=UPI0008DFD32F|nr:hypothetical protein [Nitrosomonas sp. Nm34]SFI17263.1 hypothetical protein SAMN05428978_100136 [Nitrosomonas sp. Nm34]